MTLTMWNPAPSKPAMSKYTAEATQSFLDQWYKATTKANDLARSEANLTDNIGAVKNLTGWREVMSEAYYLDSVLESFFETSFPQISHATIVKLQWKTLTLAEVFDIA